MYRRWLVWSSLFWYGFWVKSAEINSVWSNAAHQQYDNDGTCGDLTFKWIDAPNIPEAMLIPHIHRFIVEEIMWREIITATWWEQRVDKGVYNSHLGLIHSKTCDCRDIQTVYRIPMRGWDDVSKLISCSRTFVYVNVLFEYLQSAYFLTLLCLVVLSSVAPCTVGCPDGPMFRWLRAASKTSRGESVMASAQRLCSCLRGVQTGVTFVWLSSHCESWL